MRSEFNLVDLAKEIQRQSVSKKDYIADSPALKAAVVDDDVTVQVNGKPLPLTPYAHGQLADKIGMPRKWYEKLRSDHPDLLANDVGQMFQREPKRMMVRTLTRPTVTNDRFARAFLSDKFRPIDNDMIAAAALPILAEHRLQVRSSNLSDTRLYIQATFPTVKAEVKPGDVVMAGITITNSEVGAGAVSVQELIWRLLCSNGMIGTKSLSRYHVGKRIGEDGGVIDYSEAVHEKENEVFFMKIKETVQNALDTSTFDERVDVLRAAADRKFTKPMVEVVEVTQKRFGLGKGEGEQMLDFLAAGGDLTQWGLANSVTRLAQEVDADRAFELEKIGGQIVELKYNEFKGLYETA